MEKQIVSSYEFEQMYDEWLDEVYGTVEVAGVMYDTSVLWKNADPIAYEVGMGDYANHLMEEDENLVIEGWV